MRLVVACFLCSLSVPRLNAQEGTWTVSGSVGLVFLNLKSVEEDGQKDIQGYHDPVVRYPNNTIDVAPFPPFGTALAYSGRITYRYQRDFYIGLSVMDYSKQIETSYRDAEAYLLLQRKVGATDVIIDLGYYFPPIFYDTEIYAEVGIGRMYARAQSFTVEDQLKSADTVTVTPKDRARGDFKASKLFVSLGTGVEISLTSWLNLKIEGRYKFAQVGQMDGELTQFDQTYPYTTIPEFDFSSFILTSGLSIVFD